MSGIQRAPLPHHQPRDDCSPRLRGRGQPQAGAKGKEANAKKCGKLHGEKSGKTDAPINPPEPFYVYIEMRKSSNVSYNATTTVLNTLTHKVFILLRQCSDFELLNWIPKGIFFYKAQHSASWKRVASRSQILFRAWNPSNEAPGIHLKKRLESIQQRARKLVTEASVIQTLKPLEYKPKRLESRHQSAGNPDTQAPGIQTPKHLESRHPRAWNPNTEVPGIQTPQHMEIWNIFQTGM